MYCTLQEWVETDLLLLHGISTSDNSGDAFMKILAKQHFYQHYDFFMGRRLPDFWRSTIRHLVPTEAPHPI